jgi:hypothetical protein
MPALHSVLPIVDIAGVDTPLEFQNWELSTILLQGHTQEAKFLRALVDPPPQTMLQQAQLRPH